MNYRIRDPYPMRIFTDCGNAFTMGLLGGALWHFGKGVRNSPKGSTAWTRTQSGITIAKTRALRTAGSFGAWGAMFATSEFFILMARRKEDHWNSIMAGFMVASALQFRMGLKRALLAGVFGGVFMGMFEGVGMLMQHQGDAALFGTKDHKGVSQHQSHTQGPAAAGNAGSAGPGAM